MSRRIMTILQLMVCCFLVQTSFQAAVSTTPVAESDNSIQETDKVKPDICIKSLDSPPVHCDCMTQEKKGLRVNCVVFVNDVTLNDSIWDQFAPSQEAVKHLELVGYRSKMLNFVPTKTLQMLKKLEHLEMVTLNLDKLPERTFYNMPSVKKIYLKDGNLTSLSTRAFDNLDQLQVLHITKNNITTISRGVFVGLVALLELNLAQNEIKKVGDNAFKFLTALESLDLSNNKIFDITTETFDGLQNLKYLYLSGNQLTMLKYSMFSNLLNLDTLNLDNNKIRIIPSAAFREMINLKNLNLSNNHIVTSKNDETFLGMSKLDSLDLSNNDLKSIYLSNVMSVYHNCVNNTKALNLNLEGNNFTCDCNIAWIYTLQSEAVDVNLRKSLANITCLYEDLVSVPPKNNNGTTNETISQNESNKNGDRMGLYILKQMWEIDLAKLPCPREIEDNSMQSSDVFTQQKIAPKDASSSSSKVQIFLGIHLSIFTLSTFLI